MRVHPKVLPLTVTPRIKIILEKQLNRKSISWAIKERIRIILLGISGESIYYCSKHLKISKDKVSRWRKRWTEGIVQLQSMELENYSGQPATTSELVRQIEQILSDKARSGTPKRITLAQEQAIIALACDTPENHNMPVTNWTHEMLASVAIRKGLIDTISPRKVGYILKKTNCDRTSQNIGYSPK